METSCSTGGGRVKIEYKYAAVVDRADERKQALIPARDLCELGTFWTEGRLGPRAPGY